MIVSGPEGGVWQSPSPGQCARLPGRISIISLRHFSHLVFFYSHCSSAFVLLILSCPLALLWGRVGLRQANVEDVPLPGQQGLIAE